MVGAFAAALQASMDDVQGMSASGSASAVTAMPIAEVVRGETGAGNIEGNEPWPYMPKWRHIFVNS